MWACAPPSCARWLRSRSHSRNSSAAAAAAAAAALLTYYSLYMPQGIEAAFCSEEDKAALRLRFASFYAECEVNSTAAVWCVRYLFSGAAGYLIHN
eukprot:scaffold127458_cov90-Phaeocystis_antarctica.AAC.1